MKIEPNKVYTCPECDSEHICVMMACSVNPNTNDVDVDYEEDVSKSKTWSCDDCGNEGFIPDVASIDDDEDNETLTCDLCGKVEDEHDAIARGWIPDYLDGEEHKLDPVCVECCAAKITTNDDGDSILIKTAH
jgi:transcription elongation factor Elf1